MTPNKTFEREIGFGYGSSASRISFKSAGGCVNLSAKDYNGAMYLEMILTLDYGNVARLRDFLSFHLDTAPIPDDTD